MVEHPPSENFALDGFASCSRSSLVCERQQHLGLLEASAWKACGAPGGLKTSGRRRTVSPEKWRRCVFFSYFGEKNGGLGTLREENFSLDGFASSRSSLVCERQQYLGLLEASAWKACGGSGGLKTSGRRRTVSPEKWRRCVFFRILEKKMVVLAPSVKRTSPWMVLPPRVRLLSASGNST